MGDKSVSRGASPSGGIGYSALVDDWEVAWTSDWAFSAVVALGRWDFIFRSQTARVTQAYVLRGIGIGAGVSDVYKPLAAIGHAGEAAGAGHQLMHNALNAGGPRAAFWPTLCSQPFSALELDWSHGSLAMGQVAVGQGKKALRLRLWKGNKYLCQTVIIPKNYRGVDVSASYVTGVLVLNHVRWPGVDVAAAARQLRKRDRVD